jgi:enoyl-[acyl-carrier-protein] reductase (NADH)
VLRGKRLLVSGVATNESIASAVVERAIREGAEVLVAAYPKDVPAAEEVLSGLAPAPPAAVAVDATNEGDLLMLEGELRRR